MVEVYQSGMRDVCEIRQTIGDDSTAKAQTEREKMVLQSSEHPDTNSPLVIENCE